MIGVYVNYEIIRIERSTKFNITYRMPDFIPFNKISKDKSELEAMAQALDGDCWHGDGPASKRVETYLCRWLDVSHVFLTTSCTHALEMAMMVLGIREGDEVIMPSFTFVSTANAVRMRGGIPVFAEIRSSDLTLDVHDVASKITPATRAVIPVHYAGVAADFDGIRHAISGRNIAIVEDAAQAVGAFWNKRALGTLGDIGCLSFHDTKNITCGEGGAFLTNDADLAEKAEWVREKGTNRSAFLRGEVDKYTWISQGSSYIPSDLLAALLEAQLRKKDAIREARRRVWEAYRNRLSQLHDKGWISLPEIPKYAHPNYHIFHFHVREAADRNPLLDLLKNAGIGATFHYVPLHNAPYAVNTLKQKVSLARTEKLADTLIRLPLYPGLDEIREDVADRVLKVLIRYYSTGGR